MTPPAPGAVGARTGPGPRRIDVHAHFLTPHYVAASTAAGRHRPDGMPSWPDWSVDASLAVMDAAGIAAQVLSISSPGVHLPDPGATLALARHVNDAGAEVVSAHPTRFGLAATLPLPDVAASLRELERAFEGLGADAVALSTHYDGTYLGAPALAPVLAALDERRAVVMLHPTSPPCWSEVSFDRPRPMVEFLFETSRCVADLALSGALERFPGIRWIVPHAGAALPVLAHRLAAMSPMVGPAIDVPALLRGLHYDLAGVTTPVALGALMALVEPDRLLYGSDFPFTPASVVGALATDLDAAPQLAGPVGEAVARENARTLFPRLASSINLDEAAT